MDMKKIEKAVKAKISYDRQYNLCGIKAGAKEKTAKLAKALCAIKESMTTEEINEYLKRIKRES